MEHNDGGIEREPRGANMPWWKRLWRWTGWPGKTLWDWQALLFIPVTIALIASLFTQYQNNRQRDIENLRAERAMVESYLEHIGTLLLEEDLRTEGEDSDARLLARARTITVLDGVSKDRKVRVLEFLSETRLIRYGPQGEPPVISLRFADLRGIPLVKREILSNTDLDRAELNNANMDNAKLIDTRLPRADLTGADLSGVDLTGADLSGAILAGATGVSCYQAEGGKKGAKSLDGATMPNGQKYEDWLKDKEGCEE
jgi:hypothetical protein